MNTKRTEQTAELAYDGTYYAVVKGTGRRWLVVDKLNGAVVNDGIRSNAVYFASFLNRTKENLEALRNPLLRAR